MMDNISALRNDISNPKEHWNLFNPAIIRLIAEVGLNFFRFLKSLGISGDPNLVVLSSKDNYSCNETELKNARVIINLKKLNLIKHPDLFLNALVRILPPDISFIGYFSEARTMNGKGFNPAAIFQLLSGALNLFGSRTKHLMKRNEITELLGKNGFKTLNMKEMNGLTYFISQNVGIPQ